MNGPFPSKLLTNLAGLCDWSVPQKFAGHRFLQGFGLVATLVTAITVCNPLLAKKPAGPPKKNDASALTLVIDSPIDDKLAPVVGKLGALYYECYPKLLDRFDNPDKPATRTVHIAFADKLNSAAETGNGKITFSRDWLQKHPEDLGLMTHELTHIVQAYPSPDPGWVTEGIADYARQLYGPKDQPGWKLPDKLVPKRSYKDSYTTAARFFVWLDATYPGTVDKINRRMQQRKFKVQDFTELTGKDVDVLWKECVEATNK